VNFSVPIEHPMTGLCLPTPETCRWRRTSNTNGSHECGLVKTLFPPNSRVDCTVEEPVCQACCESYPPTERRLNPVVATLVHTKANSLANDGDPQIIAALEKLRTLAERFLAIDFPPELRLTPARSALKCTWLGDPVSPQPSSRKPEGATVYNCSHPRHSQTTPDGCRRCHDWSRRKPVSRPLSLAELIPLPGERSGPRIREWAVGITTSPRRQSTLEDCLDSVTRAGWESPRLFLDGADRLPARYHHLPVTLRSDSIGAWPAWFLALAELVLQQPQADAYLMLQDDVIFHDREPVRDYLEQALWPGDRPAVVSLFYTSFDLTAGWRSSPAHEWHWGAQALLFPPAIARALIADSDLVASCLAATTHIPIPEVLATWMARHRFSNWYPIPSLIQHIGTSSTIWMNSGLLSGRRAPWFSGSIDDEPTLEERHSDFPEAAFPCPTESQYDYLDRIDAGRRRMRESSVVICGICRSVRPFLPRIAASIERLGELFKDYRVVVIENDSIDRTPEFLRDWSASNSRVEFETGTLGVEHFPQERNLNRAAWLAVCRNRYHQIVADRFSKCDYVIPLDMDLAGGFSFDGIAHTFGHDGWDFVGSYSLIRRQNSHHEEWPYWHYDAWAYRPESPQHPTARILPKDLQLQRGDPLLPVASCFGGLGVYRREAFLSAAYGGSDCEHVVLHEGLRRAGFHRLFLNPSQIVVHSPG
jgi:hypothetical protein